MADQRPRRDTEIPQRPLVRQAVFEQHDLLGHQGFPRPVAPREQSACSARPAPILFIAGAEDPVGGKTQTIQVLITRYMNHGHRALEYRFYAGGQHEIFNEVEKDSVHRDIGKWISSVLDR